MSTVTKVDGVAGVFEQRKRFVRLHAAGAITKGDLVAFDFALDSTAEQDPGHGVRINVADSDEATSDWLSQAVGVATEAIAAGELGTVQVSGRCDICKAASSLDPGLFVMANTTAGNGVVAYATSALQLPVGMFIKFGTTNTADSSVYLMNPLNL
tara:strand:- start:1007 stop:1471 length:465 start_codon:yes stop_codon:yes gene_type:complete